MAPYVNFQITLSLLSLSSSEKSLSSTPHTYQDTLGHREEYKVDSPPEADPPPEERWRHLAKLYRKC